jgi:epoxyqueuosine reductase
MVMINGLTSLLKTNGADIVGFADIRALAPDVREDLPSGISIAVALNPAVLSGIREGPTRQYFEEYERVNHLLDKLGAQAAGFLKEHGYRASGCVATNSGIDSTTLATRLPHKTVATIAGIGWIGKCALLVTRNFGSAVRLNSVLTDAPLPAGAPVYTSSCGECTACAEACPARAVSGSNWQAGMQRDSLYDAFSCRTTARALALKQGIHETICGLCIVSCPWTQKYLRRGK